MKPSSLRGKEAAFVVPESIRRMGLPRLTLSRAVPILALPVLITLAWMGNTFLVHRNFRAASADLFRSGQLRGDEWAESLDAAHYRSILNLQGSKNRSWYRAEVRFASEHGLEHYDYALSAHVAPSLRQMNEIVAILRQAPKPILIHCKNGADRSGLVAALYRLAVEGKSPSVADRQLSILYGHMPWFWNRSEAMDAAFATFSTTMAARDLMTIEDNNPL